jgi:UDP-N-acetyl-D-mannosaminuronic acid dehydrogenase
VNILGVTYKGNVDDIRESPALAVIKRLTGKGYKLGIYDPYVTNFPFKLSRLEESFKDSDCAVVLADHKEFNHLSPEKLGELMRKRQIIDTKNCLDLKKWEKAGFVVRILGNGIWKIN